MNFEVKSRVKCCGSNKDSPCPGSKILEFWTTQRVAANLTLYSPGPTISDLGKWKGDANGDYRCEDCHGDYESLTAEHHAQKLAAELRIIGFNLDYLSCDRPNVWMGKIFPVSGSTNAWAVMVDFEKCTQHIDSDGCYDYNFIAKELISMWSKMDDAYTNSKKIRSK